MSDSPTRVLREKEIRGRAHELGLTIRALAKLAVINRSSLTTLLTGGEPCRHVAQQRLALVLECEIEDITEPTELEATLALLATANRLLENHHEQD